MTKNTNTKPKNVDNFKVPDPLWDRIQKHLPGPREGSGPGRPRADDRTVLNGIWYVLWTGCQWKAVHRSWFGVCSSTLHERFQNWRENGVFGAIMIEMVHFYKSRQGIGWEWQSIDSKACPAHRSEASKRAKTRLIEAKAALKFIFWLINLAHRSRCMSLERMNMTNGRLTISSSRWLFIDLTRKNSSSTFVQIRVMTTMTFTNLLRKNNIHLISSIGVGKMNLS